MQYRFGDYVLDVTCRELRRSGVLIALEPQVFDVLAHLLRHRDRVVTKDDLLAAVWHGRIVSDSTLTSRINAARRAVGDTGKTQTVIRTVARKGLRFVGELRETSAERGQLQVPLDRPSIAVLPFQNLTGDAEQEYFV